MISCVLTNDCSQWSLSHETPVLTESRYLFHLTADAAGEKLFFLPGIHNKRFMGPWFEVIASGTYKNKRNKKLKGC